MVRIDGSFERKMRTLSSTALPFGRDRSSGNCKSYCNAAPIASPNTAAQHAITTTFKTYITTHHIVIDHLKVLLTLRVCVCVCIVRLNPAQAAQYSLPSSV